jgi:hypothetical protein
MIRRTTIASVTSSVGVKVGVLCLAAAFVAVTIYGYMATPLDSPMDLLRGPIAALREDIPSHRWVAVIVSDLIMGFCLTALAIWHLEDRRRTALLWIVGVFGIGNLVTALYVLWNYDRVAALVGSTSGVRNTGHDGMSGRLGDTDATPRST